MSDTEKVENIHKAIEFKKWAVKQFPQDQFFYLKMEAACARDISRIIKK